jgi:hypothetical protein
MELSDERKIQFNNRLDELITAGECEAEFGYTDDGIDHITNYVMTPTVNKILADEFPDVAQEQKERHLRG